MIDPLDNPENFELRAAQENGELATPEVGGNTLEQGMEEEKREAYSGLEELKAKFRETFNGIDNRLGEAILPRVQEEIGKLQLQLEGTGDPKENGRNNDSTAPGGQEKQSVGQIQLITAELKKLLDELPTKVRGQQGEVQTIDIGHLDDGGSRATGIFWKMLTGHETFTPGDTIEVGGYQLTASRAQGNEGAGTETAQIEIKKVEVAEEEEVESEPVMTAEDAPEDEPHQEDNVVYMEDHKRNKPDTRNARQAEDSPGEQTRAAS